MTFIPDQPNKSIEVPLFDNVDSNDGWQGHTTTKTIAVLKSEITVSISRLGGMVVSFQRGVFLLDDQEREGYQIRYTIQSSTNDLIPGRLDIAALPVDKSSRKRNSIDSRKEKSLKMCLYMCRQALDGAWFLQQLSPGYAPLMPWMIAKGEKTVSQLWQESSIMSNLLPDGDSEFVEGDYKEL